MIRRDYRKGWILFTQAEHSILSDEIMKFWGNDQFASIEPKETVDYAIRYHDAGWDEWDSSPRIDPGSNYPASFTDMYPAEQHDIWNRCIANFSGNYPYASALVALHFNKFNNHLIEKGNGNSGSLEFKKSVEENIKKNLAVPDAESLPDDVKTNLRFLQIGDIISLAICHGWRSTELQGSPVDYTGKQVNMILTSDNGVNYKIEPYPFSNEKLNLEIKGRIMVSKTFESDEDLRKAIKNAEIQNFYFTLN